MVKNRKDQKKITRTKLLDSVKKLLLEKNFDDLQITDITKDAGVSQGTFYVHFENKEEVFTVILDEFNKVMLSKIGNAFKDNINKNEKINFDEIAEMFLDHLKENKIFIKAYASKYGYSLPYSMLLSGANPPLIDLVANVLDHIAGENKTEKFDGSIFSHAILAMWLRVGFRYALLDDTDKEVTLSMLLRLTKAAAMEFMPEEAAKRMVF